MHRYYRTVRNEDKKVSEGLLVSEPGWDRDQLVFDINLDKARERLLNEGRELTLNKAIQNRPNARIQTATTQDGGKWSWRSIKQRHTKRETKSATLPGVAKTKRKTPQTMKGPNRFAFAVDICMVGVRPAPQEENNAHIQILRDTTTSRKYVGQYTCWRSRNEARPARTKTAMTWTNNSLYITSHKRRSRTTKHSEPHR